jgi:hypothetical protein
MIATIECRKCGEPIKVDFSDLTYEEAVEKLTAVDRNPRECPGFHVELCGWHHYWRFNDMLRQVYPDRPGVPGWEPRVDATLIQS